MKFETSTGTVLSSAQLGPVTAAQRDDNSELLFRQKTGTVPARTTQVVVVLQFQRYDGSDNDGMADNLHLEFA